MQRREDIPGEIVFLGPRGNGKTVLLRWFEREALATRKVDVAWLTPNKIRDLDKLANALAPPGRFKKLRPDTVSLSVGAGKNVGRMSWNLGGDPGALTELLTARCACKPLLALLDEAHNLDRGAGQDLLNASQEVRDKAPFLLVLAGTPGLRERLNSMASTFWNRSEKLGIGRLTREATAEALTGPAGQAGDALLRLTREALELVVTESQRYPYFIQMWGDALWERAYGDKPLDVTAVAQARPAVVTKQEDYYQDRYAELKSRGLLETARAVAMAFGARRALNTQELNQAIAGEPVGLDPPARVLDTRRYLRELGYIWQAPGRRDWEPGIPSLMDYVCAEAAVTPGPAPTLPGPG